MKYGQTIRKLVILRLEAIPSNVSFSVGNHGSYTRDQLITEVEKGTPVGEAMIEMQLAVIRKMPKIAKMIADHDA